MTPEVLLAALGAAVGIGVLVGGLVAAFNAWGS